MTLLETTEPLFQYVCRLNRVGRKAGGPSTGDTSFITKSGASSASTGSGGGGAAAHSANLDYAVVRSEIKALFEDMQQKGAKDFRLGSQIEKIELPMMFFVDSWCQSQSLCCCRV